MTRLLGAALWLALAAFILAFWLVVIVMWST